MYPTLIVLLIALRKSSIERHVSHQVGVADPRAGMEVSPNIDKMQSSSIVIIGDNFDSALINTVSEEDMLRGSRYADMKA